MDQWINGEMEDWNIGMVDDCSKLARSFRVHKVIYKAISLPQKRRF